ncbi:AarF/ABC1/UbiB kinase family protein [Octadecabacter sp. G9-8]|uniref:AarF/ABC1/UbiB kinase family protein n=2 Tax=Octadecabacter dasysiphoniae TaxID=2909341 RepID=A0ABS9CX96_9RHOB|nr:AarF/ABC1/UbiB kinase family protein [Octadecabacter dasysiphoniae]MCF2871872.1 AarF/ABC1/UbiB kinase family protein [Octadecabacter dasysiphoniae]
MNGENNIKGLAVPAGRVARLSRLGRMTAGVAGNMALGGLAQVGRGERPSMQGLLLTPRNMHRIADELAKMRGAAMKMGQLMSMDTGDVLPPELSEIMARLRDDAHVMPPKQLKSVLNDQWGAGWLPKLQRFDVRPIAAASIGQVHRAQTRDGRDLAIKVQYPGVAASIDSDVTNVGALIKLTGLLPKGFALDPYLEESRLQLHVETDYTAEASALAQFGALLDGDARFVVPQGHADWSGPQILAMDYVPSVPIEHVEGTDQTTRDRVAHDLFDLMLRELFGFGLMQTDPNFANYRYCADTGQIVLLDFGATRTLGAYVAQDYRHLIKAGLAGDRDGLIAAATSIGFVSDDIAPLHLDRIVDMMEAVFAALTAHDQFNFADTALSQQLQSQGMALAQNGFVPPPLPMDALFLQRKFAGMFLLAARLRAQVNVVGLLEKWL